MTRSTQAARNLRDRLTRHAARGMTGLAIAIAVGSLACGSVGSGLKGDDGGAGSGGSAGTAGTGGAVGTGGTGAADAAVDAPPDTGGSATGGTAGAGGGAGTVGADAAVDQVRGDGATSDGADAGPLPVSCQQIKLQNPVAVSGVFTIAPLGIAQSVFCEMTVDNGGWTAFYVGDNATPPGGMHFEGAADSCPDPANRCIRRLPSTFDISHDFAVKCGSSVVKFKLAALSLDYFKNGLQHQWQPLTNAVTIDVGVVGKSNLVGSLWTGDINNNLGWIIAGDNLVPTTTFANGYTLNASWNYCNGSTQPDSSSRVMLFYR